MDRQMDEWQTIEFLHQMVDKACTNTRVSLGSESWSAEHRER